MCSFPNSTSDRSIGKINNEIRYSWMCSFTQEHIRQPSCKIGFFEPRISGFVGCAFFQRAHPTDLLVKLTMRLDIHGCAHLHKSTSDNPLVKLDFFSPKSVDLSDVLMVKSDDFLVQLLIGTIVCNKVILFEPSSPNIV